MKDAKGHGSNARNNGAGSPRSGLRSQDKAPTDAQKRGAAEKAAAGAQPVAFFARPSGYPDAAHQSGVSAATATAPNGWRVTMAGEHTPDGLKWQPHEMTLAVGNERGNHSRADAEADALSVQKGGWHRNLKVTKSEPY